jgi:hypothetical protein
MEPSRMTAAATPTPQTTPFSVRLTADERAAVVAAAAARGVRPHTYARRAVIAAAGRPVPPIAVRRDALSKTVADGVGQLGRLGNLLNQIARRANTRDGVSAAAVTAAYEGALRELSAVRAALVTAESERGGARRA